MMGSGTIVALPFTWHESPAWVAWAASGAAAGLRLPAVAAAWADRPAWAGLPWAAAWGVAAAAAPGPRSWSAGRAVQVWRGCLGIAQLPPSAVGFGVYRRV